MSDPSISNGADKPEMGALPNGATASPVPPVPARTDRTERRSFLEPSRSLGRARDETDYDFGRVGAAIESSSEAKLAATTRMVNGFMGYLKDACGRDADKLTPQDVAGLGSMLSLLQSLDAKRGGH